MKNKNKNWKISSEIIRVWFDTVINPIVFGLELVQEYLKDDNYTWNSSYQDFEEIKNLDGYVDYKFMSNYEQLVCT